MNDVGAVAGTARLIADAQDVRPAVSGAAGESAAGPGEAAGLRALRELDFLKLFIAQLKYQDPLSPVNDREFMQQLAAFATLEQLVLLNDRIAAMNREIEAIRRRLEGERSPEGASAPEAAPASGDRPPEIA
ncbi:MAG: hypothetical protein IMX05_00415 [Hydrogenibacillus schlegelii]|nr:hypothetical protein [Hydrogenibacillus schlegelii]